MSDQVIDYTPGTYVWAVLVNKVWWPGKVVDRFSVPNQLQYSLDGKRVVKAYVYFETDDTYITVFNTNNICLYSSACKLQYVKKGHSLYLKQIKNNKIFCFDMAQFIEAVRSVENELGGDPNIFDQFVIRNVETHPSINTKKLFMTEKQRKKNRKLAASKIEVVHPVVKKQVAKRTQKNKESLLSKKVTNSKMKTSTQIIKVLKSRSQLVKTSGNKSLYINTLNRQFVRSIKNHLESLPSKKVTDFGGKITTYGRYLNLGCNFVTHRCDALKRHVRTHVDEKNKKADIIAETGIERVIQRPITSCSTPEVNKSEKSLSNAGRREPDLKSGKVIQECDLLVIEQFINNKSKPLGLKTNDGKQIDKENKRAINKNSNLEEEFSVKKRDWLQKSRETMTELGHTQQDPEYADLKGTVNQKQKTLGAPLSDRSKNYVWAPIIDSDEVFTDDELFAMPEIQEPCKQIKNGAPHGASVRIKGAKRILSESPLIPVYPRAYCPNPSSMVLSIEDDLRLLWACEE